MHLSFTFAVLVISSGREAEARLHIFEQELNVTSGRVTDKQKATGPFAGINSPR